MRGVWWVFHRLVPARRQLLPLAGPTMLLPTVVMWAALLALGWALVFWPHMADGFYFGSAPGDRGRGDFFDALYISLVTLGTVGFGDITPVETWLRVITPLEALIDFADLTSRLITVERDLMTFPVSYYFSAADARFALSAAMPYLLELADRGLEAGEPFGVRLRATVPREAIDDFAQTTAARFHGDSSDPTADLLDAYARDHFRGDQTGWSRRTRAYRDGAGRSRAAS